MSTNLSMLETLRGEFGRNKDIPAKYESEILEALSHYPELKTVAIRFMLATHAAVPYGTKPSFASCFSRRKNRVYTVTILEAADYPESQALFRNLSRRMRIGVVGHELVHVMQFEKCSLFSLPGLLAAFLVQKTRRKLEREADEGAIVHGLGEELMEHAIYIRSIPGYVVKRPAINRDYLKPSEIREYIRSHGLLAVA